MSKWTNAVAARRWVDDYFMSAARIVADGAWYYDEKQREHRRTYDGRQWFNSQYRRFTLHPAVLQMMHLYRPDAWHQLLLEWPHRAETDANRLAYTRDERAGEADRQTVTTIGKYLTRHFPDAPDNVIRDIVAEHTYGGRIQITDDLDRMINAVIDGPSSCMSKRFDLKCDDGKERHPYAVYSPSLGWRMAIRYEGDDVMGRCLVWHDPDDEDTRVFVRSYKRERGYSSHSGADEAIESHLRGLGYAKRSEWPEGTPVLKYELRRGGYLMPYIDGSNQSVEHDGDDMFTIGSDGYDASNTSGIVQGYTCTCDHCGAGFNDEDEGGWVYYNEETHVCQDCLDNEFTYVYGRRGNQYYILCRDAIEVGGDYYDPDYLGDNNIVELHNGDYCDLDDAVYIDSEDAYYEGDDLDVCFAEDTARYELKDNCWQCAETGNWYTDDEEYVEVDGETYHPDNAPETETTDDDSSEAA